MASTNRRWFGLAFMAAGMIPAVLTAHAIWNWTRARSWVETPARVLSVELKSISSGGRRPSQSLELSVEYEYEWNGDPVRGDAISPFENIEVFDGYKRKLKTKYYQASREKEDVACYVDPASGANAYLDRSFRWVSCLVLGAISLLFVGVGIVLVRQHGRS